MRDSDDKDDATIYFCFLIITKTGSVITDDDDASMMDWHLTSSSVQSFVRQNARKGVMIKIKRRNLRTA
jgi:hypothetical protein